jgi:glycosidase
MKKSFCIILVAIFIISCSKNGAAPSQPVVVPPVVAVSPDSAQYGTPFANVPDTRDVSIYQVNMRAFSQTGDFQGVITRLDSIKALGVNVIYLMPIYPVGVLNSINSPYCVKDYTAVGSEFGTITDLRALVDGAHSRNMSVMIDWVANHTSWDNPWITSHKDWYEQDGNGNIISPPGMGWTDVAQLNYTNAAMRLQMIQNMKNWVFRANIDGFRCDYADGPPIDFWAQAIDTLRNIKTHNLLFLAESNDNAKYTAGFDYIFGFNFYGNLKTIYSSNISVLTIDKLNTADFASVLNSQQQVVRYLTNHDVDGSDGTPIALYGGANGSLAAFTIIAYMKGVPFIYNGQEVADPTQIVFPFTGASNKIPWTNNPLMVAKYKQIFSFRNSSVAIRRGTLTSYDNKDICAFTKQQGTETAVILVNIRNSAISFTLPAVLANTTWNDKINGGTVSLSAQVTLQPYQYLILDNQ